MKEVVCPQSWNLFQAKYVFVCFQIICANASLYSDLASNRLSNESFYSKEANFKISEEVFSIFLSLFKFLFLNEAKQQSFANFLIWQMPFSNKLIENGILRKFETSKQEHIIVPFSLRFVLKFGGPLENTIAAVSIFSIALVWVDRIYLGAGGTGLRA